MSKMQRRPLRKLTLAAAIGAAGVAASATGLAGEVTKLPDKAADAKFAGDGMVMPESFNPVTELFFQHIATIDVTDANGSIVAEIIDSTASGNNVVYTDADNQQIAFIDLHSARNPRGNGTVDLPGEPTSLAVTPNGLVLVAINTSESFTNPSGKLLAIGIRSREIRAEVELGGQPDSIAVSKDGRYAAIVIENERDEDLNDGLLPQLPSGGLQIVDLRGEDGRAIPLSQLTTRDADLSPVAANAANGEDLEPEYVSINNLNQAVVSFQENNHYAVVDLESGMTVSEFSGGEVALWNVDTVEEDLINFDSNITKRREPDTVAWIDDDSFVSANEGDYEDENGEEGGSRGFTIFNTDGTIEYESYETLEHIAGLIGHYNEGRSENKGIEPEGAAAANIRGQDWVFVASERSNFIGVYDNSSGTPEFVQVLPTGIGPEGLKVVANRGLLLVSTEVNLLEDGVGIPAMINVYQLQAVEPSYPSIASSLDENGLPIPWVALSGLTADPVEPGTLYAVSDSFLAEGFVYTIDANETPAVITDRIRVRRGDEPSFDLEGVAIGPDGNFWLGSEGRTDTRPNAVYHVFKDSGQIAQKFEIPAELAAGQRNNGIEGIAVTGMAGEEIVYVAIQRAWPDAGDEDMVETRILKLETATGDWSYVYYPLEPEGNGDWIGLSELTLLPNGNFAVIERDKGWGDSSVPFAELKAVYEVDLAGADFVPVDGPGEPSTLSKTLLIDVLPELREHSVFTAEKLEGFAVDANGEMFAVTDNDGVDDATGETVFLRLGKFQ